MPDDDLNDVRRCRQEDGQARGELLGGGSGLRPTGNVCTPGTNIVMDRKLVTRHCNPSSSKTYHGDQWVTIDVEVHADKALKDNVNGETGMQYTQPQLDEREAEAQE